MTLIELEQHAAHLESRVGKMSAAERERLLPEIRRVVESLKSHGSAVPLKLGQIYSDSNEEAVEEIFDNLPI